MKTDLNLTQVQADSIKAITMEFNAKRRDMFMDPANQGLSREDRMAKMQPLMDAAECPHPGRPRRRSLQEIPGLAAG
jgi:hypothetical protein